MPAPSGLNQSSAGFSNSSFMNDIAGFEDDFCNMENFEEHDSEMDKPHETVSNANKRDTPIKRHALVTKQKNTIRHSRGVSPKVSKHKTNSSTLNQNQL
jgi:hypothetical protein